MSINIAVPVAQSSRARLPDIMGLGGACAGLAGGLAMALVEVLIARATGQDIWHESKQIAALVYGPIVAVQPGFVAGPVVVGSLIHLLLSALLGAIFAIITRRILRLTSDFGTPLLTGLIYGMLVWMAAYFVILPVFGLVTGLLYTWLRPHPYYATH